jgi:hypothetical protein
MVQLQAGDAIARAVIAGRFVAQGFQMRRRSTRDRMDSLDYLCALRASFAGIPDLGARSPESGFLRSSRAPKRFPRAGKGEQNEGNRRAGFGFRFGPARALLENADAFR